MGGLSLPIMFCYFKKNILALNQVSGFLGLWALYQGLYVFSATLNSNFTYHTTFLALNTVSTRFPKICHQPEVEVSEVTWQQIESLTAVGDCGEIAVINCQMFEFLHWPHGWGMQESHYNVATTCIYKNRSNYIIGLPLIMIFSYYWLIYRWFCDLIVFALLYEG